MYFHTSAPTTSSESSSKLAYSPSIWSEISGKSSPVVDPKARPDGHYDFISLLAVAQTTGAAFLPLNWRTELENLGKGGEGQVKQRHVTSRTSFAFKRMLCDEEQDSERRMFRALQSEVLILAHTQVRKHPNIVALEAICWDPASEKVRPVLVYEKSPFGDLEMFTQEGRGEELRFEDKIHLCICVGSAIELMHFLDIIHGDIKPGNVLMFPASSKEEKIIPKLTDFGFSTLTLNAEEKLMVSGTPGWCAPEWNRRNHEGFTLSEAKKMDTYSFGLLCWFILCQKMIPPGQISGDKAHNLQAVIDDITAIYPEIGIEQQQTLAQLFTSTLARNPQERQSDFGVLLQSLKRILDPGQHENGPKRVPLSDVELKTSESYEDKYRPKLDIQVTQNTSRLEFPDLGARGESPGGPDQRTQSEHDIMEHFHDMYFEVYKDLEVFCQAHFRLRRYIFHCLKAQADRLQCEKCASNTSRQVAFCYSIGFGTPKDEEKSQQWMMMSNDRDDFSLEIKWARASRAVFESEAFSLLIKGGYLDSMDYVHEYRKEGILETACHELEREIKDMAQELQGHHPAVVSLSRILAGILTAIGHFEQAVGLIHTRLDDIRKTPALLKRSKDFSKVLPLYRDILLLTGPETRRNTFLRQSIFDEAKSWREKSKGRYKIPTITASTYNMEDLEQSVLEAQVEDLFLELELTEQLASILREQGRPQTAMGLYQDVFNMQKKLFSEEYETLPKSIAGLAMTLVDECKYEEACQFYHQALEATQKILGVNHPETIRLCNNLAITFGKIGRYIEAERELERLYMVLIKGNVLAKDHVYTLVVLCNWGSMLHYQKRYTEAAGKYHKAKHGMTASLGLKHPATQISIHNLTLTATLATSGKYKGAEQKLREVTETWKEVLGPEHPITREGVANLAALTREHGQKMMLSNANGSDNTAHTTHSKLQPVLGQLAERITAGKGFRQFRVQWKPKFRQQYESLAREAGEWEYATARPRRYWHGAPISNRHMSLVDEIEPDQLTCANFDNSAYDVRWLVSKKIPSALQTGEMAGDYLDHGEKDFVKSAEDSELMIFVRFTKPVNIRAVHLTSCGAATDTSLGSRPRRLKLFKNRGAILDFEHRDDDSDDVQNYCMMDKDWDQTTATIVVETGRSFTKSRGVSDLNVFVAGDGSSMLQVRLDRICFIGDWDPIQFTNMGVDKGFSISYLRDPSS